MLHLRGWIEFRVLILIGIGLVESIDLTQPVVKPKREALSHKQTEYKCQKLRRNGKSKLLR